MYGIIMYARNLLLLFLLLLVCLSLLMLLPLLVSFSSKFLASILSNAQEELFLPYNVMHLCYCTWPLYAGDYPSAGIYLYV